MNAEEREIFELLKYNPNRYLSVMEITQAAGPHKEFCKDRNWMLAILRRMETEGWIEPNDAGEYRLKRREEETTTFKQALATPGAPLGDTTIITLDEVKDGRADAA
jgi:hypothetical protein